MNIHVTPETTTLMENTYQSHRLISHYLTHTHGILRQY